MRLEPQTWGFNQDKLRENDADALDALRKNVLGPSLHRATNNHRAIDHRFHSQMCETGGTSSFLVGGFKHFLFSIIYGIFLPID